MSLLERAAVKRVVAALHQGNAAGAVRELSETARTAADAAKALGVAEGAIVKSLVFTVGDRFVLALIAGDHRCRADQLPRAFFLKGAVGKPDAELVRAVTGFTIGGVAPIGLPQPLPTVIDASLKRFETVYAAAGHPHCVFPATVAELKRLTGGLMSYAVAEPAK